MSNITLYTNDENTATGIREASFEEILDCARRALAKRVRRGTGFTSPRVTADYLRVRLSTLDHEVFCVIYLTKRHQFIACEDLFRGTIDGASVYPREVLKEALKHNAAAVILAHNHPSGVAEPSQADLDITRQLKKVLDLVEIKVLDHLLGGFRSVTTSLEMHQWPGFRRINRDHGIQFPDGDSTRRLFGDFLAGGPPKQPVTT